MLNLKDSLDKILYELVKIESITGNETKLSKTIKNVLTDIGLTAMYEKENNLVYFLRGTEEKIALIGHLDTVSPFLEPKKDINTIYGRGAVDMKAGLAVMLKLMYELKYNKLKTNKSLYFIFYTKEEGPLPNGLTQILEDKVINKNNVDKAFILEPSNSQLATGCLGTASYIIKVKGKASHSASPEKGINAIYRASKTIDKVRKLNQHMLTDNYKGAHPSIAVTQIRTTNPKNVIPDTVFLTINYRFTPKDNISKNTATNTLQKLLNLKNNDIELIDFANAVSNENFSLETSTDSIIFQAWGDIAQLSEYKISSAFYGPGSIELAHSNNESIQISELNNFYIKSLRILNISY